MPKKDDPKRKHPIRALRDEDLEFVLRFVLASGSLKEMAQSYGVSYPTIRSRLDRLIERLKLLVDGRVPDPMSDLLANMIERSELGTKSAEEIFSVYRTLREKVKGD